ncbi:MAG: alanine--tRNA ligase [Holosporales bacterium]|jgi:alanyl-tRNA synthetase|nr:alanine--tRNA ligase [Holosporales bacterium]
MFTTSEIRRAYLDFFVKQYGHTEVAASSLVPDNDPTLMFTNSGMVQFKDVFTGNRTLPYTKATTSQKSLRAGGKHNDLDNVGYTTRHHTFFEMLGNFSFGDYFKEEAIAFAWEFITKIVGLPKEKLSVTVHSSDNEAAVFWKKIAGFSDDKIISIDTNDNFWMMGDTGPCGPCTEIFYDHGEGIAGGPPGSPEAEGDRFVEIWNIVFTQFDSLPDGSRINIKKPCIDTGMGLERLTAILQGVHDNYDIDLFQSIISDIKKITNQDNPRYRYHYNVIADHIRAVCFMIADGISPSSDGRGYVLRRIIRRALRHGYNMGVKEPFLYKLTSSVKNAMGEHYNELIRYEKSITELLKTEEEMFMKTIENGMDILNEELTNLGSGENFPVEIAYKLYNTYGFPFDLTQDVLKNEGKTVDESKFNKISEIEKEKSRNAWTGTGDSFTDKIWFDIKDETEFLRGGNDCYDANITTIVKNGEIVLSAKAGDSVYIVTNKTPFYAESGGQAGDTGIITQDTGIADIIDTKKIASLHVHICTVLSGTIFVEKQTKLELHSIKRMNCSRNHTCTHMLQKALQTVLGSHVAQKGSQVTCEKIRFDFIHNKIIEKHELDLVEEIVNTHIDMALPVITEIMPLEKAMDSGAMSFFGEKYPKNVRVVTIGDNWSKELCGGEHVSNTIQIKMFKVIGVSSIGSGIRRIEAVTGSGIVKYFEEIEEKLREKMENQIETIKVLQKKKISDTEVNYSIENLQNGSLFMTANFIDKNHKSIMHLIDIEKTSSKQPKFLVISNKNSKNDKFSMVIYTNIGDIDLVSIANEAAQKSGIGIKCGGRKDLAQCGGIEGTKLDSFIANFKELGQLHL